MRWKDRGCAALSVAMGLFVPAVAHAATGSQAFTTPGEHVFVVPPAVTSVTVMLVGGNGGAGAYGTTGGAGATETATIAVTPGEKLYAEVGGDGGDGDQAGQGAGGYNGGGDGGIQFVILTGKPSGGGGGGASDVRLVAACPPANPGCASLPQSLASRLVIAAGGGGGGGGFQATDSAGGGPGGSSDAAGKAGQVDAQNNKPGQGGGRGTTSTGGAAGGPGGTGSGVTAGKLGVGGVGGVNGGGGGGGGGGGVFGGGGGDAGSAQLPDLTHYYGAGGGGGGGGASSLPPGPAGVSGLSLLPTETGAEPQITFGWTLPPPSATTSAPSAITYNSATLRGTVNPNATPLTGCQFTISPAPPGGSTLTCAQQVGSGTTPVSVSAQLLGLSPSTSYTIRLIASDAQGQSMGAPIVFRTLPPPPRISRLSVSVTRRHGRRQGAIKVTLTQAATVLFGLQRRQGTRWVALSRSFAAHARAGTTTITFGARGLHPGRYRLTAVATNSVGERSGSQRATFSISR